MPNKFTVKQVQHDCEKCYGNPLLSEVSTSNHYAMSLQLNPTLISAQSIIDLQITN